MKQNHFLVLAVVVMAVLSSCSTGRYVNNSLNMNMNQTQVVLSTNNFRVVKTVTAYVEYKEDIVRFDKRQLQQNAYAELIRKADLKGSQMLVNVTLENVQRASMNLFGFMKYQNGIMAQGVVIEFCDPSMVNAPIDNADNTHITTPQIVQEQTAIVNTPVTKDNSESVAYWNDKKNYPAASVYNEILRYCDTDKNGKLSSVEIEAMKTKLQAKDREDVELMKRFFILFRDKKISQIYNMLK